MDGFGSTLATLLIVVAAGALDPPAALADEPPPDGTAAEPSVQVQPPSGQPAAPEPPPAPTTLTVPAPQPAAPPIAPPPSTAPGEGTARPAEPSIRTAPNAPKTPRREARFGEAGGLVLSGALSASFGHYGISSEGLSSNSFGIQPAFDYFVAPDFSVGASAFFRYDNLTSTMLNTFGQKSVTYGLAGQLGLNLWLGERVSLWPKLAFSLSQNRTTFSPPSYVSPGVELVDHPPEVDNIVSVELYAPFLFHLAPHFFVGFGPDAYVDLLNSTGGVSNRRLFYGAESTVGGWF